MPNTSFSTIKKYCVVIGRGKGGDGGRGGRAGLEEGGEVDEGGDGEICNSANHKKKRKYM